MKENAAVSTYSFLGKSKSLRACKYNVENEFVPLISSLHECALWNGYKEVKFNTCQIANKVFAISYLSRYEERQH